MASGTLVGSITAATVYVKDGLERITLVIDAPAGREKKASLDLGGEGAGALDTIVQAKVGGTAGDDITVELVGDSGAAEGVTIDEDGTAVTIHFEDDVSTVADVEAAIGTDSTLIEVGTAGTGATVLDAATDEFAAANLAGGGYDLETAGQATRPTPSDPRAPSTIVGQSIDITVTDDVVTAIAFTA